MPKALTLWMMKLITKSLSDEEVIENVRERRRELLDKHAPVLAQKNDLGIARHSGDLTTEQAETLTRKFLEDHGEAVGRELSDDETEVSVSLLKGDEPPLAD